MCHINHMPIDDPARVSPTEARILDLVGQGFMSKEIGRELGLSPHTIDTHCRNVARKLGVVGRRAASREWKSRASEHTQRLSISTQPLAAGDSAGPSDAQPASDGRTVMREASTPFRHVSPRQGSPIGRWLRWCRGIIQAAFEGRPYALSVRDRLRLIASWTLGVVVVLFLAFAAFKVASDTFLYLLGSP